MLIDSAGNFEVDSEGDIILDAAGNNVTMKSAGSYPLDFIHSSTGNWTIKNTTQDKDIIFNVNDGGSDTEVMRIDGSTSLIGIGTTAPSNPLHILNTNVQLKIAYDGTNNLTFQCDGNGNQYIVSNNNSVIYI